MSSLSASNNNIIAHLRVYSFGTTKPILNTFAVADDGGSITLRALIEREVNNNCKDLQFSADHDISKVVSSKDVDLKALLDLPLLSTRRVVNPLEVLVSISTPTTNNTNRTQQTASVFLMQSNKVSMQYLVPKHSMSAVNEFCHALENKNVSREQFLREYQNKPQFHEQMFTCVTHIMSNPECGYRPVGYLERNADKVNREKAEDEQKKYVSKAEEVVLTAVRQTVQCLTFVNDHRATLSTRFKQLFDTPMLNAIKCVDIRGTKNKENRKIKQMDEASILIQISNINKAISAYPSWYLTTVDSRSDVRRGEVVISELENLKVILTRYCHYLKEQQSRNTLAINRTTSNGPDNTNTDVITIDRAPTRPKVDKRNDAQKERYQRVDKFMTKVSNSNWYCNIDVDDEAMGIDGTEWDDRDRADERKKFITALGSNKFKMGKYTYRPAGAASNFVVVFKMERSASLSCRAALQCRSDAEARAPRFLSRRETRETIRKLCSATGTNPITGEYVWYSRVVCFYNVCT